MLVTVAVAAGLAMVPRSGSATTIQATPASANSGQLNQAVSWAASHIGQNFDDGLCLQFVASAWASAGIPLASSATALSYWQTNPNHWQEHPSSGSYNGAPTGAILFWGADAWNADGHAAIAADGSGNIISTSAYPYYDNIRGDPRVFEFNIGSRSASTYDYLGWMMPGDTGGSSSAPSAPSQPSSGSAPSSGGHVETVGGPTATWTDFVTAGGSAGATIPSQTSVNVACRIGGFEVADGDTWWYQIASAPWNSSYYASADAFYNDGQTSGSLHGTPFVDSSVPVCASAPSAPAPAPSAPAPAPTGTPSNPSSGSGSSTNTSPPHPSGGSTTTGTGSSSNHGTSTGAPSSTPTTPAPGPATTTETPGGVTHTWTDYSDAGGSEGPSIPSNQSVQITCRVQGFAVADGDTWWYEIASSPWSGTYFASADAFYNDGATSGSLLGTPFVDPSVPVC
jgi:hypothetical protein